MVAPVGSWRQPAQAGTQTGNEGDTGVIPKTTGMGGRGLPS